MMSAQKQLQILLGVMTLFALMSCTVGQVTEQTGSGSTTAGSTPAAQESTPVAQPPVEQTPTEQTGGPGTFDLSDPAVGLDRLSSYRQTLALSFDGNVNGQEIHAKTTVSRMVMTDPAAQITWLEIDGAQQMYATIGELAYTQYGADGPCAAFNAQASDPSLARFQLHTLPALRGAEEAGEETLNSLATRHYTFDERAFGQAGWVKASGEVWVAVDGGYIVKYTLRLEGGADSFGPGAQGTQTWDYLLSDANAVTTPDLPAPCTSWQSIESLPLPPEAQNVTRLPGFLAFDTPLTAEQVAQFYQTQVAVLGWTAIESSQPQDDQYILNFRTAEKALLSVRIRPGAGTTQTTVQVLPPK